MRRICAAALTLIACSAFADETSDLRNARAVFEENIRAIHQRDRAKYLSLYLHDPKLIRTGPTGFATGYEDFAKGAGSEWPDTLEATDMRLTPVRPGIVYGSYRYRVRYGANESSGISERLFVETPDGWKIALTGAVGTEGVPPSPRAIRGATLIDGRGGAPVTDANVVVRDGKIECAGAGCAIPAGIDVVDAKGMFVTPGLVDTHVHFSQSGWVDGRPDAVDVRATHPYEKTIGELRSDPARFARSYLCSGVTGVFDVAGYPWTLELHEQADSSWPHVVATGPGLSSIDHWLNLPAEKQLLFAATADAARSNVRYLASAGAKAIKVWYVQDQPEALAAAGEEAAAAKLPLIVHATELARAKAALRAGARLLVHSVWDAPVDDELIALATRNGAIVSPTLTVLGGYARVFEHALARTAPPIDDPNRCVDPATRAKVASTATLPVDAQQQPARAARNAERTRVASENLRRLVAAGIPIATGTDAGNPLTLHGPAIYAEMDAMQRAGMTPMQVIVASTATAARAARLDGVTGTIEPGKAADLLILTADPSKDVANFRKLRSVMRGGVIRGVEELSAM
ncbi:MAG TPA: amidohydrolase family protein, partial [Thermoanaerobaculia bacterium]|nr:amidohydrolase family protein [Thermoanaerobaculia bacterium]